MESNVICSGKVLVGMIRAILSRGISEKQFRSVNVGKTSRAIFQIYKMLIIRTYIQGKGEAEKTATMEMFEETVDLLTDGLFISTEFEDKS
jgi:hypothetical protein